jgi:hypothetical protein
LFGRQGLDKALQDRFKPYNYESTRPALRWLFPGLLVFIAAGAFALYADIQFRGQVSEWRSDGFNEIPINNEDVLRAAAVFDFLIDPEDTPQSICAAEGRAVNATPTLDPADPDATPGLPVGSSILLQSCNAMDRLFTFADAAGLDCLTTDELATVVLREGVPDAGCEQLIDMSVKYDSLVTTSNVSTVLVILALVITAFPFSTFIHRASRNLRPMKSEGQRRSPDGAVLRFFVPIINLYEPMRIVVELFRASDPRVPDDNPTAWKKRGRVHPYAITWGLLWPIMLLFNAFTIARFSERNDLADIHSVTTRLLAADAILIALGIAAAVMANALSRWQDARVERYGAVTVTPARPRDPLEKALEEGTLREDATPRSRDNDRRKKRGKR